MKCFVIMPFGDPRKDPKEFEYLTNLYNNWIKPTVEEIEFNDHFIECYRADGVHTPGEIINHIIDSLSSAEIVIADLSNRNPNVFYELGVRHAINNNTILISNNLNDIPFDLRPLRAISYEYTPDQMLKFKEDLEKTIYSILENPKNIDNPVRRYLYSKETEKIIASSTPPGYDIVKNILSEFDNFKNDMKNQFTEMKSVIEYVTTSKQTVLNEDIKGLKIFEGMWKNIESGSLFYGKLINGTLEIPYSYGRSKKIDAHYYNCQYVNGRLYCQFEWFKEIIKGFAFFKTITENQISGGWWYNDKIPRAISNNITQINESIPGMYNTNWVKIGNVEDFPPIAKKYFEDYEK